MSKRSNYHRRNPLGVSSGLRTLFLLMCLGFLWAGCSSNSDQKSAVAIPGPGKIQPESQVQPLPPQQSGSLDAPRIALERTTYDFGEIRPQSKTVATFRLTNTGKANLKITNIQKCCGAVIKLDENEFAPGEGGLLTAEYLAGPVPQQLSKKIRLFTNDPQNPQVDLTITGKVIQTLVWTPTRFEIAAYQEDIVCPPITIKSADGSPFAIKGFTATGQCLMASFDPNCKVSEVSLRPTVDRTKLAAAQFANGRVKIDVTHRGDEAIYVDFEIKPVFEITPPRIFVVNAERERAVLRTLQLQDRRTASPADVSREIESVTFKNGGRVEMRGVTGSGKGCEINLAIWPAGDATREALWSDQLVIQMKEGRQVTVPVNVLFRTQPLQPGVGS